MNLMCQLDHLTPYQQLDFVEFSVCGFEWSINAEISPPALQHPICPKICCSTLIKY
jgi:hypothetical protein